MKKVPLTMKEVGSSMAVFGIPVAQLSLKPKEVYRLTPKLSGSDLQTFRVWIERGDLRI
jgi:hypothetical protein